MESKPFLVIGGLNVGQSFWSCSAGRLPSASLSISPDRLMISNAFPKRSYELSKDEVVEVFPDLFEWTGGIRIVHRRSDYPPYVVFSSFPREHVLQVLRINGYNVVGSKPLFGGRVGFPETWSTAVGAFFAAAASFLLALLCNLRVLPFLRRPSILSAGRYIGVGHFIDFVVGVFVFFGFICLAFGFFLLWRRRLRAD